MKVELWITFSALGATICAEPVRANTNAAPGKSAAPPTGRIENPEPGRLRELYGPEGLRFPTNPATVAALADSEILAWAFEFHYELQISGLAAGQRKTLATNTIHRLRQAELVINQARMLTNSSELNEYADSVQEELTSWFLELGENLDTIRRQQHARLASATNTSAPDHGNVIYFANQILGRVALRQGATNDARRYLLAAVAVGVAPELHVLQHAKLVLPSELLQHATEADRQAVLKFLDAYQLIWPPAAPNFYESELYKNRRNTVEKWKTEVREGKLPKDELWPDNAGAL